MLASHYLAGYGTLVPPLMICNALGASSPRSIIHAACSTLGDALTAITFMEILILCYVNFTLQPQGLHRKQNPKLYILEFNS